MPYAHVSYSMLDVTLDCFERTHMFYMLYKSTINNTNI